MKYYKVNDKPLRPLREDQVKAGDVVYDELGRCVKKVYLEENVYFVEVVESVLTDGETMSDLTPIQLDLFWKLSNSKFKKYYEDKGKGQRG